MMYRSGDLVVGKSKSSIVVGDVCVIDPVFKIMFDKLGLSMRYSKIDVRPDLIDSYGIDTLVKSNGRGKR